MNYSNIRNTLCAQLATLATANSWTVFYDNKIEEPPTDAIWLRCNFIHNSSRHVAIGSPSLKRKRVFGFMEVSIFAPINTGTKASYDIAELLEIHFDGNSFSNIITQTVVVTTVGTTDDIWWQTSVNIPFYTDIFI